nr:hypothetical protein [Tanacetum cinerariifolium]
MHLNREKIAKIDADVDITLVDMETQVDMDAELQGSKDDDNAATKDVIVDEPTMFDDEEVTMTMAQTLIKMKDEKAKILDDHVAKSIDWNTVAEQIQEKHIDNIKKYQNLKRKPVSVAQARKNMIIYLKNIAGYKMEHFRGMTYDKESFKKLKAVEVSGSKSTQDTPTNDPKEISKENVQNMLEIIPVSEFKKIIRVGGITEAYQSFEDMMKGFDREDLVALGRLVKESLVQQCPMLIKKKLYGLNLKDYLNQMRKMCYGSFKVEEDSDMAKDLVMKIFVEANKPKSRSLDTSSK